ncbi:MAG: YdeI/OmpD-associated family protein [Velocimicrobium sp.]
MSILFKTTLSKVESTNIIKIPLDSSEKLPSRGMVMIKGTINNISFKAPVEPDGKGSHWFEVTDFLIKEADLLVGQTVSLDIEPIDEWMEPEIPNDIWGSIIKTGSTFQWNALTTKARWEWIRWIRSTKKPTTRQKRIDVACSKLQKGDKRPCCFDASRCTIPEVSKSGVLNT